MSRSFRIISSFLVIGCALVIAIPILLLVPIVEKLNTLAELLHPDF